MKDTKTESRELIRKYFIHPHFIWMDPESREGATAASSYKRPLIIFLHGYGATEEDIALSYKGFSPRFAALSVRAPLPVDFGYMWFPLDLDATDSDAVAYDVECARETTTGLLGWIRSITGSYSSVTLLGFSMGMAVAVNLLRKAPEEFAAVIGLSGLVMEDDEAGQVAANETVKARNVPFFWGRDPEDPVVTENRLGFTHEWLERHTALDERIYSGIAHSISDEELEQVSEFLGRHIA